MMTKSKNYPGRKLKILNLLPLSVILFLTVAFLNGLFPQETQAQNVEVKALNSSDSKSSEVIVMQVDTTKKKVIIRTPADSKKKDGVSEIKVIGYADNKLPDSLIYIVDGIQIKDIKSICPDSIESIDIKKDDNLIIVRTKSFARKHQPKIIIRNSDESLPSDILYIVNGEINTKEQFEALDPAQIESIQVIKQKSEIKKYSDKEYEGIIKITTKAKE